MSQSFSEIEAEFRVAVLSRRCEDLPRLTAGYCTAAASEAGALVKGGEELAAFTAHVSGVLQWTRLMMLVSRSSVAAELNRIHSVSRYLARSASESCALRCEC
jgi:hypothetical protein